MTNSNEPMMPEVITRSALEAQTRAEVDVAIVTAKTFPRSMTGFLHRAEGLATYNAEIARSMEYAKPVNGGLVKGPSVRLAEIVAISYGNLRVGGRVLSIGEKEVVAQGVAHDLETNVAVSMDVTVSIWGRNGRYSESMIATTALAAVAKARRNAIFAIVPPPLFQTVIDKAREVAGGDAQTLPARRTAMLAWLKERGIGSKVVLDLLGRAVVDDITLEDMADLVAIQNSAKEEGEDIKAFFQKTSEERKEKAKASAESLKMGALRKDDEK